MSAVLKGNEAEKLLDAAIRGELPDERGRFGPFGGRYVPETLVPAFERLEQGVKDHLHESSFQEEFRRELREWVGRPTALTYAPRLSAAWGADVWLKREDLDPSPLRQFERWLEQAVNAKCQTLFAQSLARSLPIALVVGVFAERAEREGVAFSATGLAIALAVIALFGSLWPNVTPSSTAWFPAARSAPSDSGRQLYVPPSSSAAAKISRSASLTFW